MNKRTASGRGKAFDLGPLERSLVLGAMLLSMVAVAADDLWRFVALPCLVFLTIVAVRHTRRADQALAEADQHFRELIDLPVQVTFVTDASGRLLHIGQRWKQWTGLDFGNPEGARWIETMHPDDREPIMARWVESIRSGGDFDAEYRLRLRGDHYRWFRSRAFPQRDPTGAVTRWVGAVENIHERRTAEEQYRQTVGLLEMIGSSTESIIWAKDCDGRMLYINRALERLAGVTLGDVIGKLDREWNPDPENAAAFTAADRRVLESGRADDIEETFTGAGGVVRHYRSVRSPLRDRSGAIVGTVGVATDITEKREAEERERLLTRELDHRAKNLLAVVQSVVALTRADSVSDFKAAVGGRIQALGRAHSMIADSRWEGADLQRVLTEELAPYRDDDCGRIDLSGPPLMLKPGAAQSLALVIHELATNAVKYGALSVPEGTLAVRWQVARGDQRRPLLKLTWEESGGPRVSPRDGDSRTGFGSRLIRSSVERQLGGSLSIDWATEGLKVTMEIALDRSLHGLGGGKSEDGGTGAAKSAA